MLTDPEIIDSLRGLANSAVLSALRPLFLAAAARIESIPKCCADMAVHEAGCSLRHVIDRDGCVECIVESRAIIPEKAEEERDSLVAFGDWWATNPHDGKFGSYVDCWWASRAAFSRGEAP